MDVFAVDWWRGQQHAAAGASAATAVTGWGAVESSASSRRLLLHEAADNSQQLLPSQQHLDATSVERARSLPAAIAAAPQGVLLLPGREGSGLRCHACSLAAWLAVRRGVPLVLLPPPAGADAHTHTSAGAYMLGLPDLRLSAAALSGLVVSTKAAEAAEGALGSSPTGGGAAGGSEASEEVRAQRLMREGVGLESALTAGLIVASDPQPTRTLREGVTEAASAAAAAAVALLLQPGAASPLPSSPLRSPPLAMAPPPSLALPHAHAPLSTTTSRKDLFAPVSGAGNGAAAAPPPAAGVNVPAPPLLAAMAASSFHSRSRRRFGSTGAPPADYPHQHSTAPGAADAPPAAALPSSLDVTAAVVVAAAAWT
eukprot:XP_001695019.1 predicted protein [Chlamydomonas reinhardtii]